VGTLAVQSCKIVRTVPVESSDAVVDSEITPAPVPINRVIFRIPNEREIKDTVVRASVRRGRALARNTKDSLRAYVGNALQCVSCHPNDATMPNAMPWVGVYARFPQYRSRNGFTIVLEDRINDCFRRSMNGKPLPVAGRDMRDLVAYMAFLSNGYPVGADVLGSGTPVLKPLRGDTARARALFTAKCAVCHEPSPIRKRSTSRHSSRYVLVLIFRGRNSTIPTATRLRTWRTRHWRPTEKRRSRVQGLVSKPHDVSLSAYHPECLSMVSFRRLAVLLAVASSTAMAQQVDTSKKAEPLFRWRDAWIGAGIVGVAVATIPFDTRLSEVFVDFGPQKNSIAYSTAKVFDNLGSPGALIIGAGAYVVGRLTGRSHVADLGLHTTEALIVAGTETFILKGLVGRERPAVDPTDAYRFKFGAGFGKGHDSMPSGHTTAAFAAVAAINHEVEHFWPHRPFIVKPLLYTGATLVGAARVYGLRHWPSDVIIGALVGTSAGIKVVRYNHAHPNNRLDRWLGAISIAPSPVDPGRWVLTVGN
jgi:membrane-associated phospholipid phosphatase/cytochrome c553